MQYLFKFQEHQIKIKHRRRYIRKQKASDLNTSKDDLDLLGDDDHAFSGSQADLEGAAENFFFTSPSHFESLSLKRHKLSHPLQVLHCRIK